MPSNHILSRPFKSNLRLLCALFLLGGLAGCGQPADNSSPETHSLSRPATADDAVKQLVEGNHRFAMGHPEHPIGDYQSRKLLAEKQEPFVTVLGCSDSRVPPEIVFDQGPGDVFTVRVAGNAHGTVVEGSILYGVYHLHTPLVLVLGHENCGAVKAALAGDEALAGEPEQLRSLIKQIEPGIAHLDLAADANSDQRLHAAVEANVRHVVDSLHQLPALQPAINDGKVAIVGAVYDLATGAVRMLP